MNKPKDAERIAWKKITDFLTIHKAWAILEMAQAAILIRNRLVSLMPTKRSEELAHSIHDLTESPFALFDLSKATALCQSALTVARAEALEEAAKLFDSDHNAGQSIARVIRDLIIQSPTSPIIQEDPMDLSEYLRDYQDGG